MLCARAYMHVCVCLFVCLWLRVGEGMIGLGLGRFGGASRRGDDRVRVREVWGGV